MRYKLPVLLFIAAWLASGRSMASADLRLHALDCGHATFQDMAQFSPGVHLTVPKFPAFLD